MQYSSWGVGGVGVGVFPKPNMSPALVKGWFKHFPNAQGMADCGNPAAEVLCEGSGNAGRLPVSGMPPACCWAHRFISLGLICIANEIFLPVGDGAREGKRMCSHPKATLRGARPLQ